MGEKSSNEIEGAEKGHNQWTDSGMQKAAFSILMIAAGSQR